MLPSLHRTHHQRQQQQLGRQSISRQGSAAAAAVEVQARLVLQQLAVKRSQLVQQGLPQGRQRKLVQQQLEAVLARQEHSGRRRAALLLLLELLQTAMLCSRSVIKTGLQLQQQLTASTAGQPQAAVLLPLPQPPQQQQQQQTAWVFPQAPSALRVLQGQQQQMLVALQEQVACHMSTAAFQALLLCHHPAATS
jgi:hypothetical protein